MLLTGFLFVCLFLGGVTGSFYAFRFLMKVFNFVLVPQGDYCEGCLVSTRTSSLIKLLIMLLLLWASLYIESKLFVLVCFL